MSLPAQATINDLFKALQIIQPKAPKTKTYERLAHRLSMMVDKQPSWTWRYIQSVSRGTVRASAELAHAVELLAAALDGTPPEFSEAKPITINADPAKVQAGALVLGSSKQCEYKACTVTFIPVVPWTKYCPAHKDQKSRK